MKMNGRKRTLARNSNRSIHPEKSKIEKNKIIEVIQIKLKEISDEMKTQDNRSTKNPIFVVYDWEKLPADPDYVDEWEYADLYDGYRVIGTTKDDLIKYAKRDDMDLPDNVDELDADELFEKLNGDTGNQWAKIHYHEVRRFKCAFFTEKAAQQYIDSNSHNFNDLHIFVHGLGDNPEMQAVQKALLEGRFTEGGDSD